MSEGYDGIAVRYDARVIKCAKKAHVCDGCDEDIKIGHSYGRTASLYDGSWCVAKRCMRCEGIYQHLCEVLGMGPEDAPSPTLDCEHQDYEKFHGKPPPDHIADLAFWLPGDALPVAS